MQGRQYGNRTDLAGNARPSLPASAGPSQQYGQRVALERAQQAVPQGASPTQPPSVERQQQQMAAPGSLGALLRETERPGEPITAGMAMGAGPGPEVLPVGIGSDLSARLRALFAANPGDERLRDVIEELDLRAGF